MPLKQVRAKFFRRANRALVQFQGDRALDRDAILEAVEAIKHLIECNLLSFKVCEDLAAGIRSAIEQFLAGRTALESHLKEHRNINLPVVLAGEVDLLRAIADSGHHSKSQQVMNARSFCAYMMLELQVVRKARRKAKRKAKKAKKAQKKLLRTGVSLD